MKIRSLPNQCNKQFYVKLISITALKEKQKGDGRAWKINFVSFGVSINCGVLQEIWILTNSLQKIKK